jgi:hypothetical protein
MAFTTGTDFTITSGFTTGTDFILSGVTNTAINPGVKALSITKYTPVLVQSTHHAVNPGVNSLSITKYAPTAEIHHTTHAYWRVNITASVTNQGGCGLCRVQFRTTANVDNYASGGTILFSSEIQSYGFWSAMAAFESSPAHYWNWAVAYPNHIGWIGYHFPTPIDVVQLHIEGMQTDSNDLWENPKNFTLDWSNDGIAWTPVTAVYNQTGWVNLEQRDFTNNHESICVPDTASLISTGYAPSLGVNHTFNPDVKVCAFTGYAPALSRTDNHWVNPGVKTLSVTKYAPTLARTANTALIPSVKALAISKYAPTVFSAHAQSASPSVVHLSLNGYVSTLTRTANQWSTPDVDSLYVTSYAPTISKSNNHFINPLPCNLTLTGYVSKVRINSAITKESIEWIIVKYKKSSIVIEEKLNI